MIVGLWASHSVSQDEATILVCTTMGLIRFFIIPVTSMPVPIWNFPLAHKCVILSDPILSDDTPLDDLICIWKKEEKVH